MIVLRHWATRHANALERGYRLFERILFLGQPLANRYARYLDRPLAFAERLIKGPMFDCKLCGNCLLAETGLTCVTNCPKTLRNGPCGGVRENGMCEVKPDMRCVWVEAWEGSTRLRRRTRTRDHEGAAADGAKYRRHLGLAASADHRAGQARDFGASAACVAGSTQSARTGVPRRTLCRHRRNVAADHTDPADVYRSVVAFEGTVDAVNVTNSTGANCHISSLGVSTLLVQKGITPVMQIACRDRNRIAIQGDILSAAALGIGNLLCLTGDGVANGDHRGAVPVFDFDSLSLLNTARMIRDEGHFLSGRRLIKRPQYFSAPWKIRSCRPMRCGRSGSPRKSPPAPSSSKPSSASTCRA